MQFKNSFVELRGPRDLLARLMSAIAYPKIWSSPHRNLFASIDNSTSIPEITVRGIGTRILSRKVVDCHEWLNLLASPDSVIWEEHEILKWVILDKETYRNPWNRASFWYRVVDHLDSTTELFCLNEEPRLRECLNKQTPSHVLFQRLIGAGWIYDLIEQVRAEGASIIYESDDLLFDVLALDDPLWRQQSRVEQIDFERHIECTRKILSVVDKILVSTPELANAVPETDASIAVKPNRVPTFFRVFEDGESYPRKILNTAFPEDGFNIYYGGGTSWHEVYYKMVEPALLRLLARFSDIYLTLGGGIRPTNPHPRIVTLPRTLPELYFYNLQEYDLVLAPLVEGPWSFAKSAIKIIEAACQGVPFIASPAPEYRKFVAETGLGQLARQEEWELLLEKIYYDRQMLRANAIGWARMTRARYFSSFPRQTLADLM